ncbi:MAG: glycosyltransferase family 2 protein [Pirellulales bacterium]|nr:glycosyltransferase family 2 protein [Pirellulales bacterium]
MLTAAVFVAMVAAALLLHPFLFYPLTLRILARLRPVPLRLSGPSPASVSLLICARNEEAVISKKIRNANQTLQEFKNAEVLVYDDASTDGTVERVKSFGEDVVLVSGHNWSGKNHGLNMLARRARGEILIFSDANTFFEPHTIENLLQPFKDPSVGCVLGRLVLVGQDSSSETTTAALNAGYWGWEESIRSLETATGSVIGGDGSLYAIRRSLWPFPAPAMIDDFFVPLEVVISGLRTVVAPRALVLEHVGTEAKEEFRRKIRIACGSFNVHRAVWPRVRRSRVITLYKYVSHKFLKWLTGFHALTVLISGASAVLLAFGWIAFTGMIAAGVLLLLLGYLGVWGCREAYHGAVMLVAVSLGVIESIRGNDFTTWSSTTTDRVAVDGL